MSSTSTRVCVIGAGASGLAAIKEVKDEGHEVVCLEQNSGLGGLFRYEANASSQKGASVYDGVILTITDKLMCYGSFPTTGKEPIFWTHRQYLEYLKEYAHKFDLERHISYGATVTHASKQREQWIVEWSVNGKTFVEHFGAIAVCTGSHQVPALPPLRGRQEFEAAGGVVHHAHTYKSSTEYAGKKVVCVGIGESGADICREIADVAAECTLSIRCYPSLIARQPWGDNFGSDALTTRSHYARLLSGFSRLAPLFAAVCTPVTIGAGVACAMWRKLSGRIRKDAIGQALREAGTQANGWLDYRTKNDADLNKLFETWRHESKANWNNKFVTKNVTFMQSIVDGKLRVHVGKISALEPGCVIFDDGVKVSADVLMCCTGYKHTLDFIENWSLKNGDVRSLYKHAFDPGLGATCAFIGWVRPAIGGIPACSEMVARYFALLCSKKRVLPHDMRDRIASENAAEERQFFKSPSVKTVACYISFMDSLAELIGCKPTFSKYLFSRPYLAWKLVFAELVPSQYRLEGPHANRKLALQACYEAPCGWFGVPPGLFIQSTKIIMYALGKDDGMHKFWWEGAKSFDKWRYNRDGKLIGTK